MAIDLIGAHWIYCPRCVAMRGLGKLLGILPYTFRGRGDPNPMHCRFCGGVLYKLGELPDADARHLAGLQFDRVTGDVVSA